MPAKHIGQLCRRCNALEAALTVRAEPLCRECFAKYVHTKVVKRMEAFRTRHVGAGQERKLLLPMSFGVSSVTLLHILDKHLETQRQKTGRTGFSIHVLHVRSIGTKDFSKQMEALKKRYPDHEYSTIDLHDLFENKQVPVERESDVVCKLCVLPVAQESLGIAGWGGHQEDEGEGEQGNGSGLCYGCSRSLPLELVGSLPWDTIISRSPGMKKC